MMKKYVRYAMLGLAIFALALFAGCGSGTTGKGTPDGSSSASVQSESAPQAASSSSLSAEKKAQKLTIKVYYPDEQGTRGTKRIAQKVGEEGVETALAATVHDREELRNEAADLVYHLLVLLADADLELADVIDVLRARHASREKAAEAK